jgi:hypothetical protein
VKGVQVQLTMKKARLAGLAAASAAGLLLTGLSAQQASAGGWNGVCEAGEVCVYRNGQVLHDMYPIPSGRCAGTSAAYDWMWNRSNEYQRAWSGTNCTGANTLVSPGGSVPINLRWSVGGY